MSDFPCASGRLTLVRPGASGLPGAGPADELVEGQIVKLDNGFLVSRHVTHEGAQRIREVTAGHRIPFPRGKIPPVRTRFPDKSRRYC
ncbi:hypothetical protein GCM10010178_51280 [Lentzea flava]|uniref:Uncharacterized protein n=1 Tax=Lentzea flava TaxID=103732 RepID=A0ABQ2UUG5_9PSEU|nr:hypothetical protein GCM10010178_51280 [Lentzea flava]